MNQYNDFAKVYDALMYDLDYDEWVSYINDIFKKYNIKPINILETACGTGQITVRLSKMGYKMTGVDISESMLSIAESKARMQRQKIKFLNQDMTQLDLNQKFDSILCMCDGINYIVEEQRLQNFFKTAFEKLNDHGIFIFDISSMYKLRNIIGNNTFYNEKDGICYVWDNEFDEVNDIVDMELVIFVPDGKLFKKIEENHIQKAYDIEYIKSQLINVGFEHVNVFSDFDFNEVSDLSDRIFFSVQK